ncbi:MAG: PqqD family protein [Verrucomicrobia bacterium]|nr:PqqD family protein [Kiritimatiellia bacterium]MCB1100872.1 PqqD family protein [Kiritimatiellia bacterium]MCP5488977.1 PqqD family protein [Verrucomicrobiota bacterium]
MAVCEKNPGVVERNLRNATLLIPVMRDFDELNCLYSLNETARLIWREAGSGRSVADISSQIAETYDVAPDTAQADTEAVIQELLNLKLLVMAEGLAPQ